MSDYTTNSVILNLTFHKPGISKKVKNTEVVVMTHDEDEDIRDPKIKQERVSVSKKVFVSPELVAIQQHMSQLSKYVTSQALPADTLKAGMHQLAGHRIVKVVDKIKEAQAELNNHLIPDFEAAYPQMVQESIEDLGDVFNPKDYPPFEEIKKNISITYNLLSFTTPTKLLASISVGIVAEEEEKIREHMRGVAEQIEMAHALAVKNKIEKLVDSLKPTKDGKTRKISDAAVEKYNQFYMDVLANNITGNQDLANLVNQAVQLMNGATPEELSSNKDVRQVVALGMERVLQELSELRVTETGRRIFLPDEDDNPAPVTIGGDEHAEM